MTPQDLEAYAKQLGASIVRSKFYSAAIGFRKLCDAKRFYDAASGMGYDAKLLTADSVMFKAFPL